MEFLQIFILCYCKFQAMKTWNSIEILFKICKLYTIALMWINLYINHVNDDGVSDFILFWPFSIAKEGKWRPFCPNRWLLRCDWIMCCGETGTHRVLGSSQSSFRPSLSTLRANRQNFLSNLMKKNRLESQFSLSMGRSDKKDSIRRSIFHFQLQIFGYDINRLSREFLLLRTASRHCEV